MLRKNQAGGQGTRTGDAFVETFQPLVRTTASTEKKSQVYLEDRIRCSGCGDKAKASSVARIRARRLAFRCPHRNAMQKVEPCLVSA